MWKIDPKDKHKHKNKHWSYAYLYVKHVCNSGTTLWNSREEEKEKRMIVNNMEINYICAVRGYSDMY
jgi:hypothetical protein